MKTIFLKTKHFEHQIKYSFNCIFASKLKLVFELQFENRHERHPNLRLHQHIHQNQENGQNNQKQIPDPNSDNV